ncbi:lytic transglycosylase domain-containing protein [Rhizobium leguminosarum]|uniref:transglycosylase SLT domain-containing protein n=1 Tax=Rhizobium leguminosarum TaxID=384 RepID=UPI001C9486A0|nr:transglycosylase SLT domain-containing protein [Rhizobium leguminosarum]MBY5819859.1 lytic transglycosylase domain-containing protein [Rhizobium leguminosarum]
MIRKFIAALAVTASLAGCTGLGITDGTLAVKIAPDGNGRLQPSISLDLKIEERGPATAKPNTSSTNVAPLPEKVASASRSVKASVTLSSPQREVLDLTAQVAKSRGIDEADFAALVWIESKFDPRAKNPGSSASGLCQFIDATAKQYGLAEPFDARKSLEACASLWEDNSKLFEEQLGYKPGGSDLYLMHQQGGMTAISMARAGDRPAKSVASRDAIALNVPGGNPDTISAKDFLNLWKEKFERSRQLFKPK